MASKRKGSLTGFVASDTLGAAAAAKGAKAGAPKATSSRGNIGSRSGRPNTTAITIAPEDLDLLQAVAAARATKGPEKRASVSAVIASLIDDHRSKLETDAGPFLKLFSGKN